MHTFRIWSTIGLMTILLVGCQADRTEEIGAVQDCGNGLFFNLKSSSCEPLAEHQLLRDDMDFERMHLDNGLTVPRQVNGRSPFLLSFLYDVSRDSSFEVALKKVEYGQMLGDTYSNAEKVNVKAGRGVATVRIFPKDGQPIPQGKAANQVKGNWIGDLGYAIELKGGDRFEDDDADAIASWRVAGVEVKPETLDDPEAKIFILSTIDLDDRLQSCRNVTGSIRVVKTEIDLKFEIGLKEPASNWKSWGGTTLDVPAGSTGPMPFSFIAQDENGDCPPPGQGVQIDPWRAAPGAYLVQFDIFDGEGRKYNATTDALYSIARDSKSIAVDEAALIVAP